MAPNGSSMALDKKTNGYLKAFSNPISLTVG